MSVYLSSIGCANPEHKYDQQYLARFMAKFHGMDKEQERRLSILYKASGIKYRYSSLIDFQMNGHYNLFSPEKNKNEPSTSKRMEHYKDYALELCCKAIDQCSGEGEIREVTHLITISCTGMYAPGIDYEIIRKYNLNPAIERYGINFMGCFAAINGLKAGWNICRADGKAKVLIVCIELCSLHLQQEATEDNLLANALFGDGAAAMLLSGQKDRSHPSLKIVDFLSSILPEGQEDMAWNITDTGFQMHLSHYVPDIIKNGIHKFSKILFNRIKRESIDHFLIHPGGKKILKVVEDHFEISADQNKHSHHVLKNYGNMSSPTIIFVIKEFLDSISCANSGENAVAMAFGPGLTLESVIFRIE